VSYLIPPSAFPIQAPLTSIDRRVPSSHLLNFPPSIFPASNLYPQFFIHEAPPPSVSGPFIQNSMFILSALNPQATEGSPFSPSYLPMFLPFPASNLHLPEASKTNYKQKHIDNVYTIIYH
jgi:hypothetical protein